MSQTTNVFKVYQASAGSGKTYTIVKEYLELCLANAAATDNFDTILAITFTNLAANEMKSKIIHQLNDIIHSDESQTPSAMEADLLHDLPLDRMTLKANAKLLFSRIIHDYSSFCVCTIDSFVQKLARSFANDLKLPTQFSVSIDEDEVADAITERLGEKIGSTETFLTKILEDFCEIRLDNEKSPKVANSIHEFIKKLFSEAAFQKGGHNPIVTEEQYQETLKFFQNRTQKFETCCQTFIKDFEDFLQRNQLTAADFNYKEKGPCLGFLKKLKAQDYKPLSDRQRQVMDGDLRWYSDTLATRLGDDMTSLQTEFQQVFVAFLESYRERLGAYLFYKSQLHQLSLYVLRSILQKEIETYIEEEQIVHISEFNKRINEVMGDFSVPFIYERLGEHFKHVFIDEFQDTSILQWQNLLPLLDNNLANNQLNMIVGDGKQSIYRWRNGEVEQIVRLPRIYGKPEDNPIFNQFEENFMNHFSFHELKRNYRSFRNVVEFNNRFFKFSANPPFLTEQHRKVYVDEDPLFQKEVSIEQEIQHREEGFVQVELFDPKSEDEVLLLRIKELIEELTQLGFEKSDITILVRKNRTGSLIANYLNENNIDIVSAESILLKYSDKVQLLIHTLDYLVHPANKATIAAVLYYWNASHREGFEGLVDGIFEPVEAIAEGKKTMEEAIGLKPNALSSLLAKSYSLYDLCSALTRIFGFNTVSDSHLNFLLDAVHQWQSTEESGIIAFLEYWEKKKDHLSVVTGHADAVNIMTIHKSKGLEFPVVIYPFMVDNLDDKKSGSIWITPEQLGFEAIPNIEKVQFSITKDSAEWNAQTRQLYEEEGAKVRLDNTNLNYVAFTRPVQRLHVLSYQSNDEGKSPLNAFLKTCPEHQIDNAEGPIVYAFGDPKTRKAMRKASQETPTVISNASTSCEWFDKITIDPEPSMFWASVDDKMKPQEWGEFVHQVLSEVQHVEDIDRALSPYMDSGVIDLETAQLLRDLFTKMARHPQLREAFSPQAKIKTECEILSKQFGIRRPDRYAELNDLILLLDYKTGKKSKSHQEQLQQYISVLQGMVSKPIHAYLVYLDETVEVVPVSAKDIQFTINL